MNKKKSKANLAEPPRELLQLDKIEDKARAYAEAHAETVELKLALKAQLAAVCKKHMRGVKNAGAAAADIRAELLEMLAAAPHLFEAPRKSMTVDGVQIGWKKQPGRTVIPNEQKTIQRILAKLPEDEAELLIRTKQTVNKAALKNRTAGDLKSFGIEITADVDAPFIKEAKAPVDKLIEGLLAEVEEARS